MPGQMDYAVGSLSDLITGSTTPNKKKVIKRKMSLKNTPTPTPTPALETSSDAEEQSIDSRPKLKAKKSKLVNKKSPVVNGSSGGELLRITPSKGQGTKRKLEKGDENASNRKQKKNAQHAERRVSLKSEVKHEPEDPELRSRTVYVGNIPLTFTSQKFKRLFSKYGKVDSVRFRGAPVPDSNTSKKLAIIKKKFNPDRNSFFGYVRFAERADAEKAVEANGMVIDDHHLRVNLCDNWEKPDDNKAIFIGNLNFCAEEEDLRRLFEPCGNIASVRIIRNPKYGTGNGFGYVNFEHSDSVALALEMEDVKVIDRVIRIKVCDSNAPKKNVGKQVKVKKPFKPRSIKKEQVEGTQESENGGDKPATKAFQGVKLEQKKKKKFNKGSLNQKKMIKKVAPKK